MKYADLRHAVYEANRELHRQRLVVATFGNASGIDRAAGVMAIKPSGVGYDALSPNNMVIVDLEGRVADGSLRPSSDTRTHLALYRSFPTIGGVVHTHSTYATAWSQARRPLPCLGTTHADYCHGSVPCTAMIDDGRVAEDYEYHTGTMIVEAFAGIDPMARPMVLVAGHAPFTWGRDPGEAAYHALMLEEMARMAVLTLQIDPAITPLRERIRDHHYYRKHGSQARYGQACTKTAS